VLFARQSPILNVQTVGPQRIAVGKESVYQVTVANSGQVAADEVMVTISLPEWADVLGAEASAGATHSEKFGKEAKQFQWKVGRVEAKSRQRLVLRIMPRQSRPINLAVKWGYTPVATRAVIEVQEPKLAMRLRGPREVLFGKKELYKLELANSGNGDAENVVITLLPVGPGESISTTHNLGTVAAGEKKVVEVELTARQTGNLRIRIDLRGEGGVSAALDEQILVRRATLLASVEGPEFRYVGTTASYRVHLSNSGNAVANNVKVSVMIPSGAVYRSGTQGSQSQRDGRKLTWTLDELSPGEQQAFEFTCELGATGPSRVQVLCAAERELTASAALVTQVEAIADLALKVSDPTGPVAVGKETTYVLRIANRGTKDAQGVEVVAYFSHGVEPTSAEGGRHTIGPGQVAFEAVPTLAAGREIVLSIKARAETAGNHVFRAEVYCKPLGTRLVSEETTRFYDSRLVSASAPSQTRPTPRAPAAMGKPVQRVASRTRPGQNGKPTSATAPDAASAREPQPK